MRPSPSAISAIRRWSGARRTPRTPAASRPIGRTSASWKRIALPPLVHSRISRVPSVSATPTRRSSSRRSTAMMPEARGRENADSGVFLTVPRLVAMNTKCCSSNCLIGSSALIFSPSLERQQVDDRLAARAAPGLRQLEHAQPVDLAAVGEAQQRVVGVGDEELLDEILVLDRGRRLAAAAAPLRLVVGHRLRLGVARVRQRHDHVLRLDQVFGREVEVIAADLGAARVAVVVADLDQLGAHHGREARRHARGSPPARPRAPAARRIRRRSCPARGRSGDAGACRGWPAPALR